MNHSSLNFITTDLPYPLTHPLALRNTLKCKNNFVTNFLTQYNDEFEINIMELLENDDEAKGLFESLYSDFK